MIINILFRDDKIPVRFHYGIEKGQPGTFEQEYIPNQVIDLDWEYDAYSDVMNRLICAKEEEIKKEILENEQPLNLIKEYRHE